MAGLRIDLDAGSCQGHLRCRSLAPALFDVDEWGQAVLLVDADVPVEQHHAAFLAASNCPEYAITTTEVPSP